MGGGGVGGPVDTKNLRWLARFRWRPSRSVGAVRTCAPSMTADRRQSVGGERRDAFPIASLSLLIPVLTVSTSIDAIPFKSGSRSRAPARKRKKKKRKKKTNKQKALASRPRISCADTVAPTPRRQGRNYEQVQITFKLSPDWISANQLPTHTHTKPTRPSRPIPPKHTAVCFTLRPQTTYTSRTVSKRVYVDIGKKRKKNKQIKIGLYNSGIPS